MSQDWKIRAKQEFANWRDPAKLVEIKVEEWGTSVYYWPHLSMAEKKAIGVAYGDGDQQSAHVEQLIARARDERGIPLFTEREREDLFNRYSPAVIERVSMAMMAEHPSLESAEKNS